MPPSGLHDFPKKAVNYPRRKRRDRRDRLMRIVKSISYVVLGVILYVAWHHFRIFAGLPGALASIPPDHLMHWGIEASVFLAVATVPLVIHLILGLRLRRTPRRGTR